MPQCISTNLFNSVIAKSKRCFTSDVNCSLEIIEMLNVHVFPCGIGEVIQQCSINTLLCHDTFVDLKTGISF